MPKPLLWASSDENKQDEPSSFLSHRGRIILCYLATLGFLAAAKMGAALPQFSLKCADFPPKKALHRVDDIGVAFEEREQ